MKTIVPKALTVWMAVGIVASVHGQGTVVGLDPAIITQPQSQTVDLNQKAIFTVTASGTEPLRYQWRFNGTRIAGATATNYTLISAQAANAGSYTVVITNSMGAATSQVAALIVRSPPVITVQPFSRTIPAGAATPFTVTAVGSAPLSYQWRWDGTNLVDSARVSGATAKTLTLSGMFGGDVGSYSVVISNAFGGVTSAVAVLTVLDPAITSQPISSNLGLGQGVTFSVAAAGTPPLTYQWRKDEVALTGATSTSLALTNLQGPDAGSYDVVVSNAFDTATSTVALLGINLATLDTRFSPNADSFVGALAPQPDGKIVVGGFFTNLDGQLRNHIGRLNADGTLDASFDTSANQEVRCLAVQPDGKILAGGAFTTLGGQSRSGLGRLNPDGTLDPALNPDVAGTVYVLALQADGRILLGGAFTNLNSPIRSYIGRLNPDGTLDSSFDTTADDAVYALALQPDNKILVGGNFSKLDGQRRNCIGRLNPDGTLDTAFNPRVYGSVFALALQADDKILVGGFGRLNADGTLDTNFSPNPYSTIYVTALLPQVDGRILLGGMFSTLGNLPHDNIGRLNPDGSLDLTFNPDANDYVGGLALQPDGKILVGGSFSTLGAGQRKCIGRLINTDPAMQTLSFDGSSITWLRGGTSPEVWRTSFDVTTNGADWISLGEGTRISNRWQLAGVALPTNATIRARGHVTGGHYNGSAWFAETMIGPPGIDLQPVSRTNLFRTSATISVAAGGDSPLSYRWLKNGVALNDGGNLSGATTTSLSLSNLFGGNAGDYSVIISNASGSVTSAVAVLTVIDPVIRQAPAGSTNDAGRAVTFSVLADGSAPLSYQWRKNGEPLPDGSNVSGATTATLVLTGVLGADAGGYVLVLSNAWGCATSAVAILSVRDPMITVQPTNQNRRLGESATLIITATGSWPLSYQWCKESIALGGKTEAALVLDPVQPGDTGDYTVVVTNVFGAVTSEVAVLTVALADAGFDPGADSVVWSLVEQTDAKMLVGGGFRTLGAQSRAYLGRLNPDGSLDTSFNPQTDNQVFCLALQADGKILAGGEFSVLNGQDRASLGRLNPDGSLDASFDPGANGWINGIVVQPDGKILVGGMFSALAGQPCMNLGRLNLDGTLDTNFNPGPNDSVSSLALQPDEKIVVGGSFTTLGGHARACLGRLNPDGTLDASFNPGADAGILALALQADGKVLAGGAFTTLGGQKRAHIGRLNPDGTADTTFNPGADTRILTLAVQADGKLLVGGEFNTLAGGTRHFIGRLDPDGTLDTSFNPGADDGILALALQADGRVLVGGAFSILGGESRDRIGRLINTDPATQYLTISRAAITWLRGGTCPEVWRTSFDASTNGADWFNLGAGVRIPGGWQLTISPLPRDATIRARGGATGGYGSTSGWFVEELITPPSIQSSALVTNGLLTRQTGLFYQTVTVSNPTAAVFAALRLWIDLDTNSIAHGVRVWNAMSQSNGVPYLAYNQPLAPGQSVNLQIEYSVPDRRTLPNPAFQTEVVSPDPSFEPGGTRVTSVRQVALTNGLILVEFSSIAGRIYYVQYSGDMRQWQTALPALIGTGTRVQWVDTGPPKTESLPSSEPSRFYRVILLP